MSKSWADALSNYEPESLVAEGQNYQIAEAKSTETSNQVCLKTPVRGAEDDKNKEVLKARREALEREAEVLRSLESLEFTPECLELLEVENPDTEEQETILVYPYLEWANLYEWRISHSPDPDDILDIARSVLESIGELHSRGFLFRNFDPRHVLISSDREIAFRGTANLIAVEGTPIRKKMTYQEAPYTAPEIRREYSGRTLLPEADMYGFGALMAFLIAGSEPRSVVENPLSEDGYEQLQSYSDEALVGIVAKCIQPLSKNRFESVPKLLETLGEESPQLDDVDLPEPFAGAERDDKQAPMKPLSPGPLVARPSDPAVPENPNSESTENPHSEDVENPDSEYPQNPSSRSAGSESESSPDPRRRIVTSLLVVLVAVGLALFFL